MKTTKGNKDTKERKIQRRTNNTKKNEDTKEYINTKGNKDYKEREAAQTRAEVRAALETEGSLSTMACFM